MPILKVKAKGLASDTIPRPILVSTSRADSNAGSGSSTPINASQSRESLKEVDLTTSIAMEMESDATGVGNGGGEKGGFSDRAFVEDHVKNALSEGKMKKRGLVGGGGSVGSDSSSSLGSTTDAHKYISIALLLMTMVLGMIVLFIDIDGLDAFYDLMESSPMASYVIFIAMFGVPLILVILISRSLCGNRKEFFRRTRAKSPEAYDQPYMIENFDPNHSPISGVMELESEMLEKEKSIRSLEGMAFEAEDDESAVADHYL